MNKEQQELLNEAYKNYVKTLASNKELYLEREGYTRDILTKDEFKRESKYNDVFAKKWGLTIEERELSLEERFQLWKPSGKFEHFQKQYSGSHNRNNPNKLFDTFDIPTKLITITYNDKTIESYE
jgi:hypothetical protein